MWVTGKRVEGSWVHADEDSSVYELKAYAANVLTRSGVDINQFCVSKGTNDVFASSLTVASREGEVLMEFGVVSPRLLHLFDLSQPVYYADINWTLLTKKTRRHHITFAEISKFPAVSRDLALLLDKNVDFAEIERVAFATERKLLKKWNSSTYMKASTSKAAKRAMLSISYCKTKPRRLRTSKSTRRCRTSSVTSNRSSARNCAEIRTTTALHNDKEHNQ